MSFPSDFATEDWYQQPQINKPAATKSHPHPLKSHSVEDLPSGTGADGSSAAETYRPDSGVFANSYDQRRSGHLDSYRTYRDTEPLPSPPLATHPAFRSASTERLGNPSPVFSSYQEFAIVPVRPPLRPTISFGGETRVSYYSISTNATHDLDKKSKAIAIEDELQLGDGHLLPTEIRSWRFYASFALLCLLRLGCGMGATALCAVIPTVAGDIHLSSVDAFWIITSFLLASAISQPLFMRLSYAFGGRLLLTTGIVLGTAGSLACATAPGLTVLLLGRSLAGSGSGAVGALTLLIIHQLAMPTNGVHWELCTRMVYWLGAALGPIVGSATVQAMGWHYIFWITAAIGAFVVLTLPFLLPLKSDDGADWQELLKIDYAGHLLLATSIASLALAFSWAGSTYRWASWHTLLPLLLGLTIIAAFAQYTRYRLDPIIPVSILSKASALVSCLGTIIHGLVYSATVCLMPLFFQLAYGSSELKSGVLLSSWTLAFVAFGAATAMACRRLRHRAFIWAGWALVTVGYGLLAALKTTSAVKMAVFIGMLCGSGLGMLAPALAFAVQPGATTDDETIHAGPMHEFLSTLGQAMGVVVGSCVFLNQFREVVSHNQILSDYTTGYTREAVALLAKVREASVLNAPLRLDLISSYTNAMRWVWVTLCIFAGLAFLASLWFTEDSTAARRSTKPGAGSGSHA